MKRTLTITRKYQLSSFQNADIGTQFIDIPEEFVLNQELVEKLYYLQLVTGDKLYRMYYLLDAKLEALGVTKISQQLALLEEERMKTMAEIKSLMFKSAKEGETK